MIFLMLFLGSAFPASANTTKIHRSDALHETDLYNTGRHLQNQPRHEIFVAGIEGAGHHGVVAGFLKPLISEITGDKLSSGALCLETGEMPDYNRKKQSCHAIVTVGWESFPSQRRLLPNERLSLLYRTPECFKIDLNKSKEKFPNNWRVAVKEHCYRCGNDWRATLEDVSVRHQVSNRLNVTQFCQMRPQLRVIFLIRDFSRAVFSHAVWDGGPRGHAMMLAVHQTALAEDAKAMEEGSWRVLRYESLVNDTSYITVVLATARFLGLTGKDSRPISEEALTTIAKRVRKLFWRKPSAQHEAQSHGEIGLQVREVEAFMRHKWSIFDRADVQLVPWDEKKKSTKSTLSHANTWSRLLGMSPKNISHETQRLLVSSCPAPKYDPCSRCSAQPYQHMIGVERWCVRQTGTCF